MEEGGKKEEEGTSDVANILAELSQDSTENSRPSTSSACSASINTAPILCSVKSPPITSCHQHTQTTKSYGRDMLVVKIENITLKHTAFGGLSTSKCSCSWGFGI